MTYTFIYEVTHDMRSNLAGLKIKGELKYKSCRDFVGLLINID